jgi:alpha-methylacyl-CoA racemase
MGPLQGLRVLEIAGIGPGPFCAMMLADMGAEVLRIDRPGPPALDVAEPVTNRGRRSAVLNLKHPAGVRALRELAARADVLLEGYRPGVMERLGLGPDILLDTNPRLIYGRMTGWGQHGPLAHAAGHDINYIALTGALHAIGRAGERPVPPLNLVGDFGGGGMLLAFGVLCALWERERSGRGQVVDAAMTDGPALLMSMFYGFRATGAWRNQRGANLLDGGAPFYDTYTCADGRHIAIGSLEPAFYRQLLEKTGLADDPAFGHQLQPSDWPAMRARLTEVFKTRSRDQWCEIMEGSDACFAPVLDLGEAPRHSHNRARGTFVEHAGVTQPAPAPRFSRTGPELDRPAPRTGEHTREALADWGLAPGMIAEVLGQ